LPDGGEGPAPTHGAAPSYHDRDAVSALDVSIQAPVIELLPELRDMLHLADIFIAHDLPMVRHFTDRVMVMYEGEIVERDPTEEIFSGSSTRPRARSPTRTSSAAAAPRSAPAAPDTSSKKFLTPFPSFSLHRAAYASRQRSLYL
jgi:ABC-type oligopeptide transport system ATPase subunit